MWSSEDCTGDKQALPIEELMEQLNGTLIDAKCDGTACNSKVMQYLYEIASCGETINERTTYSQSVLMPNECIVGARYSLKHKCVRGNSNKVKSIYYSDSHCKDKVREYVSNCDINSELYNKDTCTESGAEDQLGVISDYCCVRTNV